MGWLLLFIVCGSSVEFKVPSYNYEYSYAFSYSEAFFDEYPDLRELNSFACIENGKLYGLPTSKKYSK